jgi:hypothetical protein
LTSFQEHDIYAHVRAIRHGAGGYLRAGRLGRKVSQGRADLPACQVRPAALICQFRHETPPFIAAPAGDRQIGALAVEADRAETVRVVLIIIRRWRGAGAARAARR